MKYKVTDKMKNIVTVFLSKTQIKSKPASGDTQSNIIRYLVSTFKKIEYDYLTDFVFYNVVQTFYKECERFQVVHRK